MATGLMTTGPAGPTARALGTDRTTVTADLMASSVGPWGLEKAWSADPTAPVMPDGSGLATSSGAQLSNRSPWNYEGSPWPYVPQAHLRARPPTAEETGGRGRDVLLRIGNGRPLPGWGPLMHSISTQTALRGGVISEEEAEQRAAAAAAAAVAAADAAWAARLEAAQASAAAAAESAAERLRRARFDMVQAVNRADAAAAIVDDLKAERDAAVQAAQEAEAALGEAASGAAAAAAAHNSSSSAAAPPLALTPRQASMTPRTRVTPRGGTAGSSASGEPAAPGAGTNSRTPRAVPSFTAGDEPARMARPSTYIPVEEGLDGFDIVVPVGASLADAVRRCPPGGRILIRPGQFAEPLQLDDGKEVHVFGQRQAKVASVISRGGAGTVDGVLMEGALLKNSALVLTDCEISAGLPRGAGRVLNRVQGVTLEGGHPTLRRCAIHACGPIGVTILDQDGTLAGCEAVFDDCDLFGHGVSNVDVVAGPVLIFGCRLRDSDSGVVVHRRGDTGAEVNVRLENCELHAHRKAAVDAGLRTIVATIGCTIHGNGTGVLLADTGKSEVSECAVTDNAVGILLWRTPGAVGLIRIASNTVERSSSAGLLLAMGGEPELYNNKITGNAKGLVLVKGAREDRFGPNEIKGNPGGDVVKQEEPSVNVVCVPSMPLERALALCPTGGKCLLYPGEHELAKPLVLGARAIQILGRGHATLTSSHREGIIRSASIAAVLDGLVLRGGSDAAVVTVMSGTLSMVACDVGAGRSKDGALGSGVLVQATAKLLLRSSKLHGCRMAISVQGPPPGSDASVTPAVATVENCEVGGNCEGVVVTGRADVSLSGMRLHDNDFALRASGAAAKAHMHQSEIVGGKQGGIKVDQGGTLTVRHCQIRGNLVGLDAVGADTSAALEDCQLEGNLRDGIICEKGARVALDRCAIKGSPVGLMLSAKGSEAQLMSCEISGCSKAGAMVRTGAVLTARDSRVVDNALGVLLFMGSLDSGAKPSGASGGSSSSSDEDEGPAGSNDFSGNPGGNLIDTRKGEEGSFEKVVLL